MANFAAATCAAVLLAAGAAAAPLAFAEHSQAAVSNPLGTSVPGCEETAEGCFIPTTATVDVGGTVTWLNEDTAAHTVTSGSTSYGPDGLFDSGLFMPETSFSFTFGEAGVYPYYCMVHPWMFGWVVVAPDAPPAGNAPHMAPENRTEAPGGYKTVHFPSHSVDVPVSWIVRPSAPAEGVIAALASERFDGGARERLLNTLLNGHSHLAANASAVPDVHGQPALRVTAGPSGQTTEAFSIEYNGAVREAFLQSPAKPYLEYEGKTESGGVLSRWLIHAEGPRAGWTIQASYVVVADGTAYVLEYVSDRDTHPYHYAHFERAASSLDPYRIEWDAPPADPRCMGDALCVAGAVTRVIDGDTLVVGGIHARLALVDADETGTVQGDLARLVVSAVCQPGSPALLDQDDGQRGGSYGRTLAAVWCGDVNLNEFLVDAGYGRIDTRYCQASEFSGEPWAAACR